MAKNAKPIPEGFRTITPHLIVRGGEKAIEFYKKAFGAELVAKMPMPGGKLGHAEMRIGDSVVMLADEFPEMGARSPQSIGGSAVTIHVYVTDADAAYQRAVQAGAKATMPLMDMFWGDRYGKVTDPFGHEWSIATHKEDVTPEECVKRAAAMFGGGPPKK